MTKWNQRVQLKQQATSNKQQATSNNNNNNFPLFSVIIPTYNRAHIILRTINSILNQTYKNYEIIISDDGSEDNTKQIIQEKFSGYPNIKYVYHENQGASHARNYGATFADGEYLYFLDSDDECLPDFLMKMYQKYLSDPELGAVYCQTGIYKNKKLVAARNDHLEGNIYAQALEQGYITSPSFITMKAECFKNLSEGWDENCEPSSDDDICFKLAKNSKIGLINEILGIYNTDSGNNAMLNKKKTAYGWLQLWNKYADDTFNLCGREIIIKHYLECLTRFLKINDNDGVKQCKIKIRKYSESYFKYLSTTQSLIYSRRAKQFKKIRSKIILEIKKFIKFKILRLK